jgi:hypothetical protein
VGKIPERTPVEALALDLVQTIETAPRLPPDLAALMDDVVLAARQINLDPDVRFDLKPGVQVWIAMAQMRRRRAKPAQKRIRKRAEKLKQLIKSSPKYRDGSFKCIPEYDRCRLHRGKFSTLCAIALFLCMAKNAGELIKAAKGMSSGS